MATKHRQWAVSPKTVRLAELQEQHAALMRERIDVGATPGKQHRRGHKAELEATENAINALDEEPNEAECLMCGKPIDLDSEPHHVLTIRDVFVDPTEHTADLHRYDPDREYVEAGLHPKCWKKFKARIQARVGEDDGGE